MARSVQVLGSGAFFDGGLNRRETVVGGHAGGDPLRGFDGDREGGLETAGVVRDHHRQAQFLDLGFRQAEADDAAAFAYQLRHLDGRQGGSGEDEVALVLATFMVEHEDALSFLEGTERVVDASRGDAEMVGQGVMHVILRNEKNSMCQGDVGDGLESSIRNDPTCLFYPDCDRRPWFRTRSADLPVEGSARGLPGKAGIPPVGIYTPP